MPVPCKHRVLRAPLEQQVRIEDSHAAIVTPEEFEQAQMVIIHALLETNDLAVGKDHRFKGRYDAEKNAVVISLEENEFENECQSKIGLNP